MSLIRTLSIASAAGRVALGAAMSGTPRWMLSTQGFDDSDLTPAALAVTRLAGIRDMVLGAQMLESLDDDRALGRSHLWCAIADAGDAAVFVAALRERGTRPAALTGLAAAVPATLLGAWAAARLR